MAHNQEVVPAYHHFRMAQRLAGRRSPISGAAAFDTAITLYYAGSYSEAEKAFYQLASLKAGLVGYKRPICALWLRHARACVGYHAQRAAMGIPEPPALDPDCGAAALATCLRGLSLPFDRQSVLAACRVTGFGSTLEDIMAAQKKLGVHIRTLTADDQGLRSLPKPLVSYVEGDHFIAVTGADARGVSYLCSDCGMWPGGEVHLTWKQWHALNPGVYAAVTRPGSLWDQRLAAQSESPQSTQVAMTDFSQRLLPMRLHFQRLPGVQVRQLATRFYYCGGNVNSYTAHCDPFIDCPTDGSGLLSCDKHGSAAQWAAPAGEPVNLATGEEEYTPPSDLTVYNPHGPSVAWGRIYNSLKDTAEYSDDGGHNNSALDFGYGWSHPYNITVAESSAPKNAGLICGLTMPNGSQIRFTCPSIATASSPVVHCTVPPGYALTIDENYTGPSTGDYYYPYTHFYKITWKDRTSWVVGTSGGPGILGQSYLYQIADRNGNAITLHYNNNVPGQTSPIVFTNITNQDGTVLLNITRDPNSALITSVSDCYGRSVYYASQTFSYRYSLTGVSQIVPTGTPNAVTACNRYTYGYQMFVNPEGNQTTPSLHTISVPNPSGSSTPSTATIDYDPATLYVSKVTDADGNTRSYSTVSGANTTTVTVRNPQGNIVYTYTAGYTNAMSETSRTDGNGHATYTVNSFDANDPLRPASVIDGNGKTTSYTWDSVGNLLSETPPSDATRTPAMTVYHYNYSQFALGELQWAQEGTKQKTSYAYFEPSGLVQSVTMPLPGTVGGTNTAATSYTYDGLGNPLTITRPGNNAVNSITTTLGYTTDGSYSQSAALGQPVTIIDNLGKVTHLRYDSQGNAVGVKDALGNETDMAYTIGNEPLQTVLPATGQTGSGHGGSLTGYLYAEPSSFATSAWPAATLQYGPATTGTLYDEGNVGAIRQTVTAYGPGGATLTVTGSTEPVAYTYDALYRMKTLTDGGGHTTSYFYNTAGYLAQAVYPGAGMPTAPLPAGTADTLTYPSYDGAGNVLSRTDGRNVTTTYSYTDPESALTDITYPAGTIGNIHLSYDAYGRRKSMSDGTGSQTYAYDDDDALTSKSVTWPGFSAKTISYGFYADGSRQKMQVDTRPWSYTYDGVGRLKTVVDYPSETTSYTYLDNGWLNTKTLSNGAVVTTTHDPQGRVTDLLNKMGTTTLSQFHVPVTGGFDGVGNRLSVTSTVNGGAPATYSGTTNYQYDYGQSVNPQMNRSQVTQEASNRNGTYTNVFSYDGGISTGPGNPTSFKGTARTLMGQMGWYPQVKLTSTRTISSRARATAMTEQATPQLTNLRL